MLRKCSRCGVEKDLSEFVTRKDRPFGKDYRCKECDKERQTENWQKIKSNSTSYQKHLEYKHKDYSDNPEKYKKRRRRSYLKHRKEILTQEKEKYMKNPDKKREYANNYRKQKKSENPNWKKLKEMAYKTRKSFEEVEQWFNQQWMKQQAQCAICNKVFSDDGCIDHDHKTNELRGLLCKQCNVGLGSFKDSSEVCLKASKYLTNFN